MWWAIVALTTTGYGDAVPITNFGRLLGGITALLGVAAIALPIGILSSAFVQEVEARRRKSGMSAAILSAALNQGSTKQARAARATLPPLRQRHPLTPQQALRCGATNRGLCAPRWKSGRASASDRARGPRARRRLFYGRRCPFSRLFLPTFEAAEPGSNVPFVKVGLYARDERRTSHAIDVTPTLVYFEHGEELERAAGLPLRGLSARDLDEFLALVDNIEEEPRLPKRMHGPRRS